MPRRVSWRFVEAVGASQAASERQRAVHPGGAAAMWSPRTSPLGTPVPQSSQYRCTHTPGAACQLSRCVVAFLAASIVAAGRPGGSVCRVRWARPRAPLVARQGARAS